LILYPAIDIRGGRTVRLAQGDYDRETAFDDDPAEAARRWADGGARFLHVVDLDGAREGRPVNLEQVSRIIAAVAVPIQLGGGLRDERSVEAALEAGASRVVLGTAAQADPDLLERLRHRRERIVASVDTRGGRVSVSGWTKQTDTSAVELVRDLSSRGVRRFVFTPVEVDGMLSGPGTDQLRELAPAVEGELIYSGGIGSLDDLREIVGMGLSNLGGAIVGRALYESRFTVAEGQRALDEAGAPSGDSPD
jgi:phosphoribosylformimino-5-aminoimidazole carboxamide ribotide isomerase